MTKTKLNIFAYSDFREFVRDRLAELKSRDSKYSLRFISNKLGLSSKSHIKMVTDGKHNISPDLAKKLAALFGLKEGERRFFLAMVEYSQAKSVEGQCEALEEMRASRVFAQLHKLALDQYEYYADRLLLVMRELVDLEGFEESHEWISARLPFKVGKRDLKRAIDTLLNLQLLRRDDDDKLATCDRHIATENDFESLAVHEYYSQRFAEAAESLKVSEKARRLGGMTFSISEKSYHQIETIMNDSLDRIRAVVDSDEQPDEVYQFVMGFYPHTTGGELTGEKRK